MPRHARKSDLGVLTIARPNEILQQKMRTPKVVSLGDRRRVWEIVAECGRSLPCWGGHRQGREIVAVLVRLSLSSGGRCRVDEVIAAFADSRRVWEFVAELGRSLPS